MVTDDRLKFVLMRGSIKRRGSAWRVIVDAGTDPVTGKRRQLTATCKSQKAAEDKLNGMIAELRQGIQVGHAGTVGELLDAWFAVARLAPTTRNDYRSALKLIPDPLRATPVWKVRPYDLDALYADLERRQGIGPARIRRVHNILSTAFGQAVKWQWLTRNPVTDASPPPVPKPRIKAPTPEQVRTLLDAADGQLAVYLRLSAHLGARRGEVCALQWSDFDLDAGVVTIERAWGDGGKGVGMVLGTTKTDKARTIALGPNAVATVRGWRAQCAEVALGVGATVGPWVFSSDPLHVVPVRPDRMTKLFEDLRTAVGLPDVQLKQLRHHVASELYAAGYDDTAISGRLGHGRTSTTKDFYAAFRPVRDRAAAEELDRLLG